MKQKITRDDRLKDLPHVDIIVENGEVHIPSIFMFKEGCDELFSFLFACRETNCTVVFDNENLKVVPGEEGLAQNIMLSMYAYIAVSPTIVENYMRYLLNIDKMNWEACENVKGEQEPILEREVNQ